MKKYKISIILLVIVLLSITLFFYHYSPSQNLNLNDLRYHCTFSTIEQCPNGDIITNKNAPGADGTAEVYDQNGNLLYWYGGFPGRSGESIRYKFRQILGGKVMCSENELKSLCPDRGKRLSPEELFK